MDPDRRWTSTRAVLLATPGQNCWPPPGRISWPPTTLKTPVRTPVANAFAERWIGTLRRELLDRTIIWNRRQLNKLVVDYIDHDNTHRPHRSLHQRPPIASDPPNQPDRHLQVVKPARCDGLINEYRNAA